MSAVLSQPATPSAWRQAGLALLLALACVLLLYRDTFGTMVGIWSRSDTFAHAFLVPPIALWLAWRQRSLLQRLPPCPQLWVLLPMAGAAAGWLLGDMAGVNALTQLAATALLVLTVPALLGTAVARALLFPLCFLFFMVPVGEFVMPQLMQWTADVTVFALKVFGIPVYREGLQFIIPSGNWSVIEACSGVRYLIASFMVGTLFAYLNYASARKRVLFGIVSLLVPVLANWARAVMIVMLGHLSNNKLAAGVDHIIYGWVFFGVVVLLMFFIGARWADGPQDAAANAGPGADNARALHSAAFVSAGRYWAAAALVVALLALPPLASRQMAATPAATPVLVLPALAGAAAAPGALPLHTPLFEGPAAQAQRAYGEGAQAVTVHVAYYRHQTYGHKLVNSQNVLVKTDDRDWQITGAGTRSIAIGGRQWMLRSAELRAGTMGSQSSARRLQVRQIYWVGGRLTTSDQFAAALGVLGLLTGRGDDGAMLTFYMAGEADETDVALDAFVARHLDTLTAWLAGVQAAR